MPLSKIQLSSSTGRRNLLDNGDFQIFQRATSATNPGGGYDTADRWRSSQNSSGLGNYNAEKSTDTPDGFGNSYKLTKSGSTTISSGMSAYIEQYIEGQNVQHLNYGSSSAKKLTASFHVKSSVTGTYGCFLGDGTTNGKKNVQTFTISSANTWEKKVLTFNGDTATGLDNDNSAELVFVKSAINFDGFCFPGAYFIFKALFKPSVAIKTGQTALTLIFLGPSSFAKD